MDAEPRRTPLPPGVAPGQPLTALAPMQDVTDLGFMQVVAERGAPDYYVTEFLRVHAQSRPEKHILRSIDENRTGRPVFAQLIGEDVHHLTRTVELLLSHPIAGIDLNLGCPAPKVYRKNVGGGLLRDPPRVAEILAALRRAVPGLFTVKMRIGFSDARHFPELLRIVADSGVDLLTVHGRTVLGLYRSEVDYSQIALAVASVPCPVLANGNVTSARRAREIVAQTGAAGVMIGRHAIRNPWIFAQCRDAFAGRTPRPVSLGDVHAYVRALTAVYRDPEVPERARVNRLKKFLNFVGQGVDPEGRFLHDMRRVDSEASLEAVCAEHLGERASEPFADEPHPGVIARPNCETPEPSCED